MVNSWQFLGGDNLTIVDEEHRTTYPYSAIVALTTYYEDGTMGQSTGIMIDRNTLLTCGHCVYDPISGMATGLEEVSFPTPSQIRLLGRSCQNQACQCSCTQNTVACFPQRSI